MKLRTRTAAVLFVVAAPALIGVSALPEPLLGRTAALSLGFGLGIAAALAVSGSLVGRVRRLAEAARGAAEDGHHREIEVRGDDEIADLAHSLNAAGRAVRDQVAESERRNAALRDIVVDATHDVLLPLNALHGHLAELGPGAAVAEVQHIAGLLRNLAAAAALETAVAPVRAALDLNAVLLRVVIRASAQARLAGVELVSAVPETTVWIDGDALLVEQALANVIDNAVAYNHRGGHVAAVLIRRGGEGFALRIEDDGPGVRMDELPRLTERHFRGAHGEQVRPGGRGLGLYIVARVAGIHGFVLELARGPYGGLVVELRGRRRPAP
ncbi:sensor histidine kinase [Nannocystis pusilla]|uniref:histidine kinase n=1 Tax=Nannocystis pusilla TaxID=889268 RepID=A0ABS7U1G1_9BACT|nr:HAMP domain-containing sensor histidine kinase [Nannocystis pusilla]MBZ5714279.1 HAMP domain-containing histidine kinase [Nannocystis pusilla]